MIICGNFVNLQPCSDIRRQRHSRLYIPNHHLGQKSQPAKERRRILCAGVSTIAGACGEPGMRRNCLRISFEDQFCNNMEKLRYFLLMDGVDTEQTIYQYMDLDYLLRILDTRTYFVKPKQSFHDLHESCLPLKSIFKPHLVGREYDKSVVADTNESLVRLRQFRESGTMLTACWTEHLGENALMWRNFTSKIGICIKSSIHNFMAAVDTDDYDMWCGRMVYTGIHNDTEIIDCLFTKDKAFIDEDEIRFYFIPKSSQKTTNDKGVSIPIMPQVLIDEIILSPYINVQACKVLTDFINDKYNVDKQNRFKVRTSEIKMKL